MIPLIRKKPLTIIWFIVLAEIAGSLIEGYPQLSKANSETNANSSQAVFNFSPSKNVIIIVLDSFVSPSFTAITKSNPALAENFKDFTYYQNTLAAFSTTAPSIPAILSSQRYDNQIPMNEFLQAAMPTALPVELNKRASDVSVLSLPQLGPAMHAPCYRVSNVVAQHPQIVEFQEALELLDFTLFRSTPQFLKRKVYAKQRWFLQRQFSRQNNPRPLFDSIELINSFTRRADIKAEAPTFKFIHLMIPHPPLRVDKNCAAIERRNKSNKADFEAQASCALKLVSQFTQKLKDIGIYDSSMIVVTADHGYALHYLPFKRPAGFPILEQALPLLLIKYPNSKATNLNISDAPASIIDIPATVMDSLNYEYQFEGQSLVKLQSDAARERVYRRYAWTNDFWHRDYLPKMQELIVNGDVKEIGSWKLGKLLVAPK